jgi:hypothetical protein
MDRRREPHQDSARLLSRSNVTPATLRRHGRPRASPGRPELHRAAGVLDDHEPPAGSTAASSRATSRTSDRVTPMQQTESEPGAAVRLNERLAAGARAEIATPRLIPPMVPHSGSGFRWTNRSSEFQPRQHVREGQFPDVTGAPAPAGKQAPGSTSPGRSPWTNGSSAGPPPAGCCFACDCERVRVTGGGAPRCRKTSTWAQGKSLLSFGCGCSRWPRRRPALCGRDVSPCSTLRTRRRS